MYQDDEHELDVEFSRWDVEGGPNAQFVVQPWDIPGHREQFDMSLDTGHSTHLISWDADSLFFRSVQGHDPDPPAEQIIHEWEYVGDDVPGEGDEKVHLNLWLLQGQSPSDGQEAEMVIQAFEWTPLAPPSLLYGDVTGNAEITAYDAAQILQHTVGLHILTGEDSVAADVSGMMGISAYDASLILQYVVDKISVFPVEQGGVPDPTKALAAPRTVSVGKATLRADRQLSIPILIDGMEGVVSGDITISFFGKIGRITIRTTELTSGYLFASKVEDGCIKISFAGVESNRGSGPVLVVEFDEPDVELLSSLRLDQVILNEGRIPARIERPTSVEERHSREVPSVFALLQNYPNPFNPETTIRYDVAKAGTVRLSVYAPSGQHIRTLVDGERPAGSYSVTWDGTDDASRHVASNVYLCRMEAGDYRAVRKVTLVR